MKNMQSRSIALISIITILPLAAQKPKNVATHYRIRSQSFNIARDRVSLTEHANIFDLTTCMHMHTGHFHFGAFYNALDVPDLVNGNTKLAINMPGRDLEITTGHNMWIQPDTNGIAIAVFITKLL